MELVNSLLEANKYTKLDICNVYGYLRDVEGDKDILAFLI